MDNQMIETYSAQETHEFGQKIGQQLSPGRVCLIEWANLIEEILPEHYTEITIEKNPEKGFDYRKITVCTK